MMSYHFRGALTSLFLLFSFACSGDDPEYWKYPTHSSDEQWDKNCSGTYEFNGCDDCNPCTDDTWCPGFDGQHIPPIVDDLCAPLWPKSGCAHRGWTTPPEQINDCFPIKVGPNPQSGRCCAGVCVDNDSTCSLTNVYNGQHPHEQTDTE